MIRRSSYLFASLFFLIACGEVADSSGADASLPSADAAAAASPDADTPLSAPITITLISSEETAVTDRNATANFNGQQLAVESTPGWLSRSYVRFDVSSVPAAAVVDEAKLELYYCGCDGIENIGAFAVGGPWSASTVTWNTQPSTGASPVDAVHLNPDFPTDLECGDTETYVASSAGAANKSGWYITSLAQGWVDGLANHGLVLKAVPETVGVAPGAAMSGYFAHAASNTRCGSNPPRLVVTYRTPTSP